jgi:hypothetical protein
MTAQEQITVQKIALKLDTHLSEFKSYVQEDEKWKKEFAEVVTPLIKQEADKELIRGYLKSKAYYFLKVIGAISAGITIIYYFITIIHPTIGR